MANPSSKSNPSIWKVLLPVVILVVVVTGGLLAIKVQMPHAQKTDVPVEIQVGNTLPDFSLTRLEGTTIQISALKSKIYLVNFWATWCEACMDEMPTLVKLRDTFKERGFEVLGINLDENPDIVVPKAMKQYKIEFPVFKDPDGKIAELFDVHAIPLTVIMDNQRKILFLKDGGLDWSSPTIHSQVERWLSG